MAFNESNTTSGPAADGQEPESEAVSMEAYSAVLSATALGLAAVLGGGGSLSVLLAIFLTRRVRKYSYALLIVFFILCCGMDLVWSPVELVHLMVYHHTGSNPTPEFPVITNALYIVLCAGIAILVTAFCVENGLRLLGFFRAGVRLVWPAAVCVILLLTLTAMTASLFWVVLEAAHYDDTDYLMLHPDSSSYRVSVLSVFLLMVVLGSVAVLVIVVVTFRNDMMMVKNSESILSNQGHNAEPGKTLPNFFLNQSHINSAQDDVISGPISPGLPKLPDQVISHVTNKTNNGPKQGEASTPSSRGPSMLNVGSMVQILGRRRHTICQIGDSANPPEPITKPKQYTYVRKFSVDISALQAQLENPRTFKDKVPFQSDQDLTQRQQEQDKHKPRMPENRGPLLPLKNLESKFLAEEKPSENMKMSLPARPPAITVSEEVKEDSEGEIEEESKETQNKDTVKAVSSTTVRPQYTPIMNKEALTDIPILPVTQPVDEEDEEDEEEVEVEKGKEGGANSIEGEQSSSKMIGQANRVTDSDEDFTKMTLLMALTFILCTFPLFLMEALKDSVYVHTYVNVCTCVRALSLIQTIIYPHIVICMDSVVNRAVGRLRNALGRLCSCRDSECMDVQPEPASSTTSQV